MLVFYPFAFSPVCTDQLSLYQELIDDFEAQGVTLYGVSVDSALLPQGLPGQAQPHDAAARGLRAEGRASPRRSASTTTSTGSRQRALLIDRPDGTVSWSLPVADVLDDLPGANLIFDALESAPA